jgi:hypothetical protein
MGSDYHGDQWVAPPRGVSFIRDKEVVPGSDFDDFLFQLIGPRERMKAKSYLLLVEN